MRRPPAPSRRADRRPSQRPWGVLCLLALLGGPPLIAQAPAVAGEDLVAAEDLEDDRRFEMEDLLWQADQLAATEDPSSAVALYGRVIDLAAPGGRAPAPGTDREMLLRSLLGRAGALLSQQQKSAATADIERLLALEPDYRAADPTASRELSAFFDQVRKKVLGTLRLTLTPADSVVRIDGRLLPEPSRIHAFPAGPHDLRVERPGFEAEDRTVDLRAGREAREKFQLERSSAAIHFRLSPADSWVEIDGWRMLAGGDTPACTVDRTATSGSPPTASGQAAAEASCLIGGLEPGTHEIAVGGDGWRTHRFQFEILALEDYRIPDVALERTSAEIRLLGLPPASAVGLDGQPVERAAGGEGEMRIPASPGDHRIVVNGGGDGLFVRELRLSDRQSLDVPVELLPSISLVAVLGPDRVAATDLAVQLEGDIGTVGEWAFLDNTDRGPETLRRLGFESLRAGSSAEPERFDWSELQRELDRALPASLHLVASLSQETYASHADLWLLPAAPGPARPVRLSIERQSQRWSPALLAALAAPFGLERLSIGADLVDVPGTDGPTVTRTTPGGAAEIAGLQAGQVLLALDGESVDSVAELRSRLESASSGARHELALDAGPLALTTMIEPVLGPLVVSPPMVSRLYPVVWARLRWLAANRRLEPWVADLNRAALHLAARGWSDAIAVLQTGAFPVRAGLGAGTAQYWLGLALLAEGREAEALGPLRAAAADAEARLQHDDGPLIAPRAALHLAGFSPQER